MQLVLSSGFLNVSTFPLTLSLFIGYPLILVPSTNLHVFATTVCLLTLRPTSLTFLPLTPLPVSFAHLLTTLSLSSVVHLSVLWPMVKCLSHTPPLLLRTLFVSRSALLIMSLHSDPELKLTFSFTGEIACNKYPVLLYYESCYILWHRHKTGPIAFRCLPRNRRQHNWLSFETIVWCQKDIVFISFSYVQVYWYNYANALLLKLCINLTCNTTYIMNASSLDKTDTPRLEPGGRLW